MKIKIVFILYCNFLISLSIICGQNIQNNAKTNHGNKFEQLGTILPGPNDFRTASGAPGAKYWQNRADYDIDATLDEKNLQLKGVEWVSYFNNSPDKLDYIWMQLDENEHDPNTDSNNFDGSKLSLPLNTNKINSLENRIRLEGYGVKIEEVLDENGKALHFIINQTMMRIDLPIFLAPGSKVKFKIKWHYKIPDRTTLGGRGGFEYFPGDGNYVFTMTQWYPRLCVYSDFQGWQNKQFTGRAEFSLAFGNFKVKMTVPSDHVVSATGQCQNYDKVLSTAQFKRWQTAQNAKEVSEIVTLDEAKNAELTKATVLKTWVFTAENVRDFAWGSSRKFIWDAMPITIEARKIMCMSYYPKEAYTLWRKYSTKTVAHTLKTYSKYAVPYPYPVASSVEASNGMEYPMICFNSGRTEKDGTYTESARNNVVYVIIHEVGHNFFPMIINSDERQWTWMDEGFNTFLQFLTEQEFDSKFPSARGPAYKIVDYMKQSRDQLEPIMTNAENIRQYGSNAYSKTATALNILRETILGRELFDFAFKEYCKRWAFKHPTPADFFRTMEDASAVDLDWFWRGWFYDTDPVDIAIDSIKVYNLTNSPVPLTVNNKAIEAKVTEFESITKIRNREAGIVPLIDRDTFLQDFYYSYKAPVDESKEQKQAVLEVVSDTVMDKYKSNYYYEVSFTNKGGLVMPIIIQWNFVDGTSEIDRINAYIWRNNEQNVIKTFVKKKEVASIILDPLKETGDINEANNIWNINEKPSRFQLFKSNLEGRRRRGAPKGDGNPMQKAKNDSKG